MVSTREMEQALASMSRDQMLENKVVVFLADQ